MVGEENRSLACSFYTLPTPPTPTLLLTWTVLLAAWWALMGRPGPSRPTAASSPLFPSLRCVRLSLASTAPATDALVL